MTFSSSSPRLPQPPNRVSPLFTYSLKQTKDVFFLQQAETNFTLTIEKKGSTITYFCLADSPYLSENSLSLYDAALIDLTLEGLNLLYQLANQENHPSLLFKICPLEADPLKAFSCLFHTLRQTDSQTIFTLLTNDRFYQRYQAHRQTILTKIGQELWKRQRHDRLIQTYFQSQQKGGKLNLRQPLSNQNVLLFKN